MKDTIYIAEPIYSERLQSFDPGCSFPPIKKIGITTGSPQRRERELLGTLSPVKIAIVKAWTGVDARAVESMLHNLLDGSRLDGEYFWDGNETLVDATTNFISIYHTEAVEIQIRENEDVTAASSAADRASSQRLISEVVPGLEAMGIEHTVTAGGKNANFKLGDYRLRIGARTNGRYTLTIFSATKSTENALEDFSGSQEQSPQAMEEGGRIGRIPLGKLEHILDSLSVFIDANDPE